MVSLDHARDGDLMSRRDDGTQRFDRIMSKLRLGSARGERLDELLGALEDNLAEVLPALVAAVDDPELDYTVRIWLMSALTWPKDPIAVDALAHLLDHPDPEILERAVDGLRAIGTREARTILWHHEHGGPPTGGAA